MVGKPPMTRALGEEAAHTALLQATEVPPGGEELPDTSPACSLARGVLAARPA